LHAERLELRDVLLDGRAIASGPAGDHQLVDDDAAGGDRRGVDQCQLENVAWHETPDGMSAMKTNPRRTRADPFKIV
jgi:hypothetical protein